MSFAWPETTRTRFAREAVAGTHTLGDGDQFCDDGLVNLLDRYPRERLAIWRFGPQTGPYATLELGSAGDVAGRDILDVLRAGNIWINLRAASDHLPALASIGDALFSAIEAASGRRTLKRDVGVLLSSPGVHVHYHLDIPLVALVQVRGEKRLHLYPSEARFAPDDTLEAVVLREREEDVSYTPAFEADATVFDLVPGQMVTWPQFAPHRVQNGPMMNVSLSCEFMTWPALIRANAVYTNAQMRRRLGLGQVRRTRIGPLTLAKAAAARLLKPVFATAPNSRPTAVSFVIDPARETGVRPVP